MLELAIFCQILAWPAVALCALGSAVYVAYDWRRPSHVEQLVATLVATAEAQSERVTALGTRVGQLEISQGVKRR